MEPATRHISVCICTFRRPALLTKLLGELARQRTEGRFTYSVVVADNDSMESGRQAAADFAMSSGLPITYCMEPEQNIALARNKALENAAGDFVAFIDDDEYPASDWLLKLYNACESYKADGVLGPARPYFGHRPPDWVVRGKFFERPEYATGYELTWFETRTGNVLLRRDILGGEARPFRPAFGLGGEDQDFFRAMMEKGHRFVWCNEAVVHELVPPSRCRPGYLLRRDAVRATSFKMHRTGHTRGLVISVIAVPVYSAALPVLALFGQHMLMKCLLKLAYHGSRVLSFLGLQPLREREKRPGRSS